VWPLLNVSRVIVGGVIVGRCMEVLDDSLARAGQRVGDSVLVLR
jgi:hypothetical protein